MSFEPPSPADSGDVPPVDEAIIGEEEALLTRVVARAAAGLVAREEHATVSSVDRDLISLRDAIGEAKPEDIAPLVEQMTRLAAVRDRLGGSKSLPIDVKTPYFAHLVLEENGKQREVLIGKRGFIDRSHNVQIVDWRNAPVSQIYYRYEEGDDYEEDFDGRTQEGLVKVRRNLTIAQSELRRVACPQGTFVKDQNGTWSAAFGGETPTLAGGQGSAQRAKQRQPQASRSHRGTLGTSHQIRADKHLPEIAALIDREQFGLIAQASSGVVVIQGGAGSGKTTVALHRMAYLAFNEPRRFRPNAMLFVVPADALVRYVSSVLPDLGVGKVAVVTYVKWAQMTRKKLLPESPQHYNDDTPDLVSRLKKHPFMIGLLASYVSAQVVSAEQELQSLQRFSGFEKLFAEWQARKQLSLVPRLRRVYKWAKESQLSAELRAAAESLLAELGTRASDVLEDWAECISDRSLLEKTFVKSGVCTEYQLQSFLTWTGEQLNSAPEAPVDDDGEKITTSDGGDVVDASAAEKLDPEDDAILLRLIQLKRGSLSARGMDAIEYEHLAIDEAQDRSALEIKVLVDATKAYGSPNARSVTIAGDTAQRVVFDNSFSTWAELLNDLGYSSVEVSPLKISYRSTVQIMAVARRVLGPEFLSDEAIIAREGAPVDVFEFAEQGQLVAMLGDALRALMAREPSASVVVLTRYPEQSPPLYEALVRSEVPSLRLVKNQDFAFTAGVDVTDVTQVKGLEFDYVVLADVNKTNYPDSLEARHLLHIGMTRAMHQLWILAAGEASTLLPRDLIQS